MAYKVKKGHIKLLIYDGGEWITNGHWMIRSNRVVTGEVKLPKEYESLVKAGIPFRLSFDNLDTTLNGFDVKGTTEACLGTIDDKDDLLPVKISGLCFMGDSQQIQGQVVKVYNNDGEIIDIAYINREYSPLLSNVLCLYFDGSSTLVAYDDDSCCVDSLQVMLAVLRDGDASFKNELEEVHSALVQRQEADTEEDQ